MAMSAGDLLKHVCDYQSLVGRRTCLRAPLSEADAARMEKLEELLADSEARRLAEGTPPPVPRRRFTRVPVTLHATVEVGARTAPVTIGNVGGGGVFVTRDAPGLRRGERTLLTVSDPATGRAFLFPAFVAWTAEGRMGLAFTGIPKELARAS